MITLATILSVIVSYTIITLLTKRDEKKPVVSSDKVVFINTARQA